MLLATDLGTSGREWAGWKLCLAGFALFLNTWAFGSHSRHILEDAERLPTPKKSSSGSLMATSVVSTRQRQGTRLWCLGGGGEGRWPLLITWANGESGSGPQASGAGPTLLSPHKRWHACVHTHLGTQTDVRSRSHCGKRCEHRKFECWSLFSMAYILISLAPTLKITFDLLRKKVNLMIYFIFNSHKIPNPVNSWGKM